MFLHRNIHKYTRTSPEGKAHNQIDHVFMDRRRHSSTLDARMPDLSEGLTVILTTVW
jgi:hypothetical protein